MNKKIIKNLIFLIQKRLKSNVYNIFEQSLGKQTYYRNYFVRIDNSSNNYKNLWTQ